MSADERARLLSATRGAARVWCGAAGYYDSGKPSLDAMAQLTGFRLKPVALANMGATPTAAGERMGLTAFGSKSICKPAFAVADASPEEALATYADGSVAVAMRRTPTGLTFYIGPPELTPELARLIARAAGAHLYADNQAAVSANGPYLCVHATRDGPVRVDTGRTGPVVDIVSGQKLGEGPAVVLNLQTGDTRLLKQ